jgi:hypothetical protein
MVGDSHGRGFPWPKEKEEKLDPSPNLASMQTWFGQSAGSQKLCYSQGLEFVYLVGLPTSSCMEATLHHLPANMVISALLVSVIP